MGSSDGYSQKLIMDINKLNNADFHIVSLMNKRKIDYKLVLLVEFVIVVI